MNTAPTDHAVDTTAPNAALRSVAARSGTKAKPAGLYLYGVISAEAAPLLTNLPAGLADAPLTLIAHGPLCAVASVAPPSPTGKLRPERRHLTAHQRVATAIARTTDLLPVAFGTVSATDAGVIELLETNREQLVTQLARIAGRSEWTLRLALDVPEVFKFFVEADPELRAARDRMLAAGGGHDAMMAVGRLFEHKLAERRDAARNVVIAALTEVIQEDRENPLRSEKELCNFSLLADRARAAELDAAIERTAALFDDQHTLSVSGPWPPSSFVDVRLEL